MKSILRVSSEKAMKVFALFFLIAFAINFASANEENNSRQKCWPGSRFMIECNECVCSDDGTEIACTKKACPPLAQIEEPKEKPEPQIPWGPLYIPGTPCIANKVFFSECNQCFCGKDGKTAVCTLMACEAFRQIYKSQNAKIEIVDQ